MTETRFTRRLSAILAADIVGFTRLMGADEAGTIVRVKALWTDLFNPAVAFHRGRVVKLMGDGALVEFPSVVDAVNCALDIQRRIGELHDDGHPQPLMMRIGVNLGDVVIDGDDILGEGVNIAARLESKAPVGGILVSEIVHSQVRGKVGVVFQDVGELELKNVDQPVRAWRWHHAESAGTAPNDPAASDRTPGSPTPQEPSPGVSWEPTPTDTAGALLERGDALAVLRRCLAAAATRGQVVLVAGEAGIGKSSLLKACAVEHRAAGGRVWWGACDALETPLPLAPLVDIAKQVWSDRTIFTSRLEGPRPALFEAVLDEMRRTPGPLLVVVEDLHWADDATLDLLKYLARRIDRAPVLLALPYRDDEVNAAHPLRRVLGDLPPALTTRLSLPPLSAAAVESLARSMGRSAAGIHAATQGNAFFVSEMLRDQESLKAGVPARVQDVVLARFARLSQGAQALLQRVAVVPGRIETELLDELGPVSLEDVESALACGLLVAEGDDLRFRHELGRVAVESSMSRPAARQLHRQVLAALSAPGRVTPAARLVHHAVQAADRAAITAYAPQAARDALHRMGYREAAAHWRTALKQGLPRDEDERMAWLDAFASVAPFHAGLEEELQALRELQALAQQRGETARAAVYLARQMGPLAGKLQTLEARQALEQAVAMVEPLPPSAFHAEVWAREAHHRMLERDYARSIHWGRRALGLAQELGEARIAEQARTALGAALLFVDYPAGRALLQGLIDERRAAGRVVPLASSLSMLGSGDGELMHLADAERELREAVDLSEAQDVDLHYPRAWLALCLLLRGQWQEAGSQAAEVLGRSEADDMSRLMAWLAMARLRLRRGDPGIDEALQSARPLAEASATLQRQAPMACMLAEAALACGRPDKALPPLQAALPLALANGHPWFVGELGYWLWRAGGVNLPAAEAMAEPYRLEVAGLWREAARIWQELGMPYERARALSLGDRSAQREALSLFDDLGAKPAADELRRMLQAVE